MQQKRKRTLVIASSILVFLVFLFCILGILGTMVSLKYNTTFEESDTSTITGSNLSHELICWQIGTFITAIIFIGMMIFRKRILKSR
jgi:hypothetical protein